MKILIDGQTLSTIEIGRGIGVVFKNLCEQLVLNDLSKDWFISVRYLSDLNYFRTAVRKRLCPIIVREALIQKDYTEQTTRYSELLQKIVNKECIDAYWTPNPLMMNIVLPTELRDVIVFATIYDVIPIVMKGEYLRHWPKKMQNEYKRRLYILPGWAHHLLFISECSKNDFQKLDNRVAAKAVVAFIAVDHTKFWPHSTIKNKSNQHYVLFLGGFNPRKNMKKALEAFSLLIKASPKKHEKLKFYVVCATNPEVKAKYETLAKKLGVLNRLILTGHVNDNRLTQLYRDASVFFFPSRYEGFGLPILEAMACGLPVVTTNVSSIPEIAGNLAYYCSVDDTKDMARALEKALREGAVDEDRWQESIQRAKKFTWAKSAVHYSKLFSEKLLKTNTHTEKKRLRIGYVTPWPPQHSGIADYNYEMVFYLKESADITLYLEKVKKSHEKQLKLKIKKLSSLPHDQKDLDIIIYHIGNNISFHKEIYKMAWNYPGLVVLHDVNIHPFLYQAFFNTGQAVMYEKALTEGYGDDGISFFKEIKTNKTYPNVWKFPMSHAIVKRSLGTIVHSLWAKEQFKGEKNVFMIPLGAVIDKTDIDENSERKLRARFKINPEKFLISSFGFVNKLKRIPQILEAVNILIKRGYPLQFLIAGNLIDPTIKLRETIKLMGLKKSVIITGYLNEKEFKHLIQLSDIIVNLRCPSMGESSWTLLKALAHGKPCIVSNYRQFSELPNSVCWKVDIDKTEVSQLVAYLEALMRNPAARKQLGKNAAFFVENYSSHDFVAKFYLDVVARIKGI